MMSQVLPPAVVSQLQKAQQELAARRVDAAAATLSRLLASSPACTDALGMAGMVAQLQGQYARAMAFFRKAIALAPDDPRFHAGLGMALFESGAAADAVAALRRACELAPGVAAGWFNLGRALKLQVRTAEAIEALQQALRLDPAHVPARLTLADALASIGNVDAAARELRRLLRADPAQAHAWFALSNLKVIPFTREEVALLRRNFEDTASPPEDRVLHGFVLARALEDQGEYAASFAVLQRANRMQRQRVRWEAAAHRAHMDGIRRAFAGPPPAPIDPRLGHEVIFVASIPRSGSTLVEQVLASHPDVEGANEITDLPRIIDAESRSRGRPYPEWIHDATPDDWYRLGNEYLARTARWRERKPRFVDKNLVTWKRVGAALAMLPAARVILVRRDPLETCLACYRQWFASGTPFAYDLDEMAAYCIDFTHLSDYWLKRNPGRVFDLEYEALVAQPEATIRRLLEFCDLPFDSACLAPHRTQRTVISAASAAQVRQPMHGASRRADRYGPVLDGLRERLRSAGLLGTCIPVGPAAGSGLDSCR